MRHVLGLEAVRPPLLLRGGDDVDVLLCGDLQTHAWSQQERLLACRLFTHIFVNLFKEQFEGASGAQQPGVAVLQTMAQQVIP